ncbi:hypothetical protein EMPG_12358 [Blastomyces silverae]|uniref:Uncharacterized protein n=1 Tax=Blastomyces silverae TaxID=2060906 RepID=A0A0H1BNC8_9EURO|nr:hypothetical protein EMPG_12358 [Blastomyces silverae]
MNHWDKLEIKLTPDTDKVIQRGPFKLGDVSSYPVFVEIPMPLDVPQELYLRIKICSTDGTLTLLNKCHQLSTLPRGKQGDVSYVGCELDVHWKESGTFSAFFLLSSDKDSNHIIKSHQEVNIVVSERGLELPIRTI